MMKLKFTYTGILALVAGITMMCGCTSSEIMAKSKNSVNERKLVGSQNYEYRGTISEVKLNGLIELNYIQDPNAAIATLDVKSYEVPMSMWDVKFDGNTLDIRHSKNWKGGTFNNEDSPLLVCTLRCRELDKVDLNSVSEFHMKDYSSSGSLLLSGTGASVFNISSISLGSQLTVSTSGACNIKIDQVSADNTKLGCSGASSVDINHLTGRSASFIGSGAVDYDIYDIRLNTLTVNMSGASDADLSGQANRVSLTASGASDIKARNLKSVNSISLSKSGTSDIKVSDSNIVTNNTNNNDTQVHIYRTGDQRTIQTQVKTQTKREKILEP